MSRYLPSFLNKCYKQIYFDNYPQKELKKSKDLLKIQTCLLIPPRVKYFRKIDLSLFFIHGKLGTSKIDCEDKIQKKPCLFIFSSGKQALTANGPAFLCYAGIIPVQKRTEVIKSNTAGFLRIQRHRKRLKRILKRPLK